MTLIAGPERQILEYRTRGGIAVRRETTAVPVAGAIDPVLAALDQHRGVLLASSYEYPGRYTRWDIGSVAPPLQLVARERDFAIDALNDRGRVLLPAVATRLAHLDGLAGLDAAADRVSGTIAAPRERFAEEDRSKQRSVFTIVRALVDLFYSAEDGHLGLYGAFGYDLAFQFEPIAYRLTREPAKRDLVLFLPDRLVIVDHTRDVARRQDYELAVDGASTGRASRPARSPGRSRGGATSWATPRTSSSS